nr:MAG TPA: hypothetical protein [Caudoviricetes sp.]
MFLFGFWLKIGVWHIPFPTLVRVPGLIFSISPGVFIFAHWVPLPWSCVQSGHATCHLLIKNISAVV